MAAGLLAALVTCAAVSTDGWWPLTAWQLFSRVRTAEQAGWQAVAVTGGAEQPVPFAALPRAFRGAHQLLREMERLPPSERARICGTWRSAMAELGAPADAIRVDRVTTRFTLDGRPPVVTRAPAYSC